MASKRKQDEKNLKTLRELASKEHNKKCFDCGQRGPTYVNMTIGSFVCTSCSGLLRGLNPPQRVKSISMTSFTQAEIEQLQKSGNEYCRHVWLGLWNSHLPPEPESRDEQKVKDFLIKKYEKKAYYVPPDQVKPISREKEKEKVPEVRPLKSLLGENSPKVHVNQNTSPRGLGHIKQPPPASNNQPVAVAPPPGSTAITAPSVQPKTPSQDLLGDLGGDPFGAPQAQAPQANAFHAFGQSQGAGGFADFSQAFGSAPSQQAAGTSNQNAFAAFGPPVSQTTSQATFAAFSGSTMTPTPAAPVNQASKSMADLSLSNSSPSSSALSASDKYSALSELDSIFSSSAPGSNTSVFGATSSTSSSAVFGQTPPATSGFGQSSSSSSSAASIFGQTQTATSSFGQTPTSSTMFGQAPVSTSAFGGTQSSTVPASGMEANPFGGFAVAPSQPASQPNPFMMQGGAGGLSTGQPNGMFGGTSQAGGFGWDTPQSTAGFGQMPQQTQNMGGFGQFGAAQGMGVQPGMVAQHGMVAQPGMAMGTQPQLGAGAMQMNGGVNRGMPPTQQASMNMGYNMQAQGGFGMAAGMQQQGMAGMQFNKAGQFGGGFGQMAPGQPTQAASFGTWNPSGGGGFPQQNNPFMGHSAAGIPPKGQSSNPFM